MSADNNQLCIIIITIITMLNNVRLFIMPARFNTETFQIIEVAFWLDVGVQF